MEEILINIINIFFTKNDSANIDKGGDYMETIDTILNLSETNNKFNFKELKKYVLNEQITPFIGAGMSIGIYCGWKGVLKEIQDMGHLDSEQINELDLLYENDSLIEAAGRLAEFIGNDVFLDKICSYFDKDFITKESLQKMPVHLLPNIFHKHIVTTNYDLIVETVYKNIQVYKNLIVGNKLSASLVRNIESDSEKPTLIKIHGSVDERETIVMSSEHYHRIYDDNSPIKNLIDSLFKKYNFLFLGCSLEDDMFCNMLVNLNKSFGKKHFAFMEKPSSNVQWRKREQELLDMGITVIWYPTGHYESITILLDNLLSKVPQTKHVKPNHKADKKYQNTSYKDLDELINDSSVSIKNIVDSLYRDSTNDIIVKKYFVEPYLYEENLVNEIAVDLSVFKKQILDLKKQENAYLFVGEPCYGKTMILLNIYNKLYEKGEKIIYLKKSYLEYLLGISENDLDKDIMKTLSSLYNKTGPFNKKKKKIYVIIDSLEEVCLTTPNYKSVVKKLLNNKYVLIMGVRNDNEAIARDLVGANHKSFYLRMWKDDQIKNFIEKRYQKNSRLINRINIFLSRNKTIKDLMRIPFYALMITFLFAKNGDNEFKTINNVYSLYDRFYIAWIRREIEKFKSNLNEDLIFNIHWDIAMKLYKNKDIGNIELILNSYDIDNTIENRQIIGSILKYDIINEKRGTKKITGFIHDTFIEFIIVKKIITSIINGDEDIDKIFPIDFKRFNVKFFENAVQTLDEEQELSYKTNLESIYYHFLNAMLQKKYQQYLHNDALIGAYDKQIILKNVSQTNKIDNIKNSILYCYGKIKGRYLRQTPEFLLFVYNNEVNIRIRICAALAGIKHKIFLNKMPNNQMTYEEDFLNKIRLDVTWNSSIRSIYLCFCKDKLNANIMTYNDYFYSKWDETRKRNLNRINKNDPKCIRTMACDLTVLYIFYQSREWKDFKREDYKKIMRCNPDNYPNEKRIIEEIKDLFYTAYKDNLEKANSFTN